MADGLSVAARLTARSCVVGACVAVAACGGSSAEEGLGARVTRVIDGDTVEMRGLGRVRLIGVDTPEQNRCFENAATSFTRERLEGRVVRYELGAERRDRYDRALAYLRLGGEMHNLVLVREGYARVLTIPPNERYESAFERAERRAREGGKGLWRRCDPGRIAARRASRAARVRREAMEEARTEPEREGAGGCLPSATCPGKRDGDGDGCYCE